MIENKTVKNNKLILENIINKLVHKSSMKQEVEASAEYIEQQQKANEQK